MHYRLPAGWNYGKSGQIHGAGRSLILLLFTTVSMLSTSQLGEAATKPLRNPAILALVSDDQATHFADSSGHWSQPSTWQNNIVPGNNARVVIPAEFTVTVNQNLSADLKTIRVDGVLRFASDQNTRLKVETLVVTPTGFLEMGTAANPINSDVVAEVRFVDDGPIDLDWDPEQLSRGALLMGQVNLFGAAKTDKSVLAAQPVAGATSLVLTDSPLNWNVGDRIVITGTSGATSDEVRTIQSVDGTTVGLNQPLELDHVAPKPNLNVYVANLSRNIQFRSENIQTLRRGHIMLPHNHNVSINYAGFYDLGRTDKSTDLDDIFFEFFEDVTGNHAGAPIHYQTFEGESTNIRGRYALHFHRGGVDPKSNPVTVHGSVVDGSPGWGFVNHSSHIHFTANVAYGVFGAAYYTESGDEIGSFDGNIAIRTVNPRSPVNEDDQGIDVDLAHENQEFGNSGDGFWLSGHLVSVTNNVSSGSSGHGIIIWSDGLVEDDLGENSGRTTVQTSSIANGHLIAGRTAIPVWWAPLAEISNNEVSGAVVGFRTRYIHSNTYLGEGGSPFHERPPQVYIDTLNPVIDGLKSWGNREGVWLNYSERLSLRNAEIVGIGQEFVYHDGTTNVGVGLDLGTAVSRGSGRIENVTIEGFAVGFVAPRNDQWTMNNMTFRNTRDMMIHEPRMGPRTMTMSNFTFADLTGTAVEGTQGQRQNIWFFPVDFTDGSAQPYFFLLPDRITLDGQGIYSNNQDAGFVVLQEEPDGNPIKTVPDDYVGLTNQMLQEEFGLSFGGAVTPADAQQVAWVAGGRVGTAAPAASEYPELFDMTSGGDFPSAPQGGPNPEQTANRLAICSGETVTLMNTNFNTTDTNTAFAELVYTVQNVSNGLFAHRDAPATAITNFTQAEIHGGVIRFVHDGSVDPPAFESRVTDGQSTTAYAAADVVFCGQGSGGKTLYGDVNLDGVLNLLDVGPFIDRLSSGTFQEEADVNMDGAVNLLDVEPFIVALSGA